MKSKYPSNPTSCFSFFLSIFFVFLSLFGASGSVFGQWTQHLVDSITEYHYVTRGCDVDNDGDMDLLLGQFTSGNILFYENNSSQGWTKYFLDTNSGGIVGLDLADFNRDGNIDVVADHYNKNMIVWYRSTGTKPIEWIKDTVDASMERPSGVFAADINGDSVPDIITKGYDSGELIWYQNNLPQDWTKNVIGTDAAGSGSGDIIDYNGDNKPDIARSVTNQDEVVLYINKLPDQGWIKKVIDRNLPGTRMARPGDLDNDGDVDIVASVQRGSGSLPDIVWYQGDGSGENWVRYTIANDLQGSRGISIKDFDSNGYLDVVATDPGASGVFLFINEDGGKSWIKRTIDDKFSHVNSVFSYDIDMDGDFDIIPSRDNTGPLVWYENPFPSAYANSLDAIPYLIQAQDETLIIKSGMFNPENHPMSAWAAIQGEQSGFTDTIQLYDDGQHDDGDSMDNFWGNSRVTEDLPEDAFLVDLYTYDSTYGDTLGFVSPARFLTLGPVGLMEHSFVTSLFGDNITPAPGAFLQLELELKNNSSKAVAKNISVELSSPDTFIIFNSLHNYSDFQDIPAGESTTSENDFWINISDECPVDTELAVVVSISSYGQVCWQDTIQIQVLSTGTEINRTPEIRIYPNPANSLLNIETEVSGPYLIEISSLNGQLLYTNRMEGSSHQIDLSSFHEGIYLLNVRSNNFIETRKLIKLE